MRVLLIALSLFLVANLAFGQGGVIGVYDDSRGWDCNVTDAAPGLLPVFVVHSLIPGATASQFCAPKPDCMVDALWLSDTPVFAVTVGNSQEGVSIGYGACLGSPIHVLTINYFAQGTTPACCEYPVLPAAIPSCEIEVVDCSGNVHFAAGLTHRVNGNATCYCSLLRIAKVSNPDCPTPTEPATWGQIKALYK